MHSWSRARSSRCDEGAVGAERGGVDGRGPTTWPAPLRGPGHNGGRGRREGGIFAFPATIARSTVNMQMCTLIAASMASKSPPTLEIVSAQWRPWPGGTEQTMMASLKDCLVDLTHDSTRA